MATLTPPYFKLSNGDVITFEKRGPFRTAVLSNSEGVLIRKGTELVGSTEKAQADTLILGFPDPKPTIIQEVLTPQPPPAPPTPPPAPTPPPIPPQKLEDQRQQEAAVREKEVQKMSLRSALTVSSTTIAMGASMLPLDRINQTINTKVVELKSKAVDTLQPLLAELGIKGIETGNPTIPDLCPPQRILDKALIIRDALLGDLEKTAKYINIINQSLTIVNKLLNGSIKAVTAINLIKTTAAIGVKAAPVVPGFITALLADLDDVRTLLTFDKEGSPKLVKLKQTVDTGTAYIATAAATLNIILGLLQVIDKILKKCGKKPSSPNKDLTDLLAIVVSAQASNTNSIYKGFIFEVVDKYFSPTLNQKIGQARNKQGIVLLQTEPSFTQDPKVLIEELKFIIDRDNLKADAGPENNPVLPTTSTPPETTTTLTTPTTSSQAPSVDVKPLGFAGTNIGQQAGIPRGIGNLEDLYEWTGSSWNFIGTRDI